VWRSLSRLLPCYVYCWANFGTDNVYYI